MCLRINLYIDIFNQENGYGDYGMISLPEAGDPLEP
jgi:hypothetical protein